jgi:hypothetical protein
MSDSVPRLIEAHFKNYLSGALRESHKNRVSFYQYTMNISALAVLLSGLVFILYTCYHNKLSPEEKEAKRIHDEASIISKIRFYQEQSITDASQRSKITDLPTGTAPEFREMFNL